ncbi:hypothetical protein Mucpa_5809 [Mucilaginibacter paludis DSM 18603]|uniref:Uncharacterized protein n=2 Tax=Mucilaginibacter TaxID=423349 RepID=H1Y7N1_9SPHI|nr:hypothetical protein Mucpa_5809 [Mucilaginibacter paludis DSM 18603]
MVCSCLLFSNCKPVVSHDGRPPYFDLKAYFTAEAQRLGKQQRLILKTVNYNNQPEEKDVAIKNWQRELALFTESDINKPSWRDSYKKTANNDSIVYRAVDTNLNTRYISIHLKAKQVSGIRIVNFTKNLLYQTKENLSYYPDSLYKIEKHQSVKILGANNYEITGKFK